MRTLKERFSVQHSTLQGSKKRLIMPARYIQTERFSTFTEVNDDN